MGITERKEREKEKRRNEIISAATSVFFENGYDNSTMDDVAKKAELSKGTLYLYFKSKEDVLFAIFAEALKELRYFLDKGIHEKENGFINLISVGKQYVNFSQVHRNYFRIITYFETKSDECYHICNGNCNNCEILGVNSCPMELLVKVILKGQQDGSLRADIAPNIFAHLMWSHTTGLLQAFELHKKHFEIFSINPAEFIEKHFEVLSNGIKNR